MADAIKNFVKVNVSTGYNDTATSVVLSGGEGAKLPNPAVANYNLVWWNSTDYINPADDPYVEISRVTGLSTDTLTIVRPVVGNSYNGETSANIAQNHNIGGKAYRMLLAPTYKIFADIETEIAGKQATMTKGVAADINAGTDDVKYITSLAVAGSWLKDGWIPARETWTYASSLTFTVAADLRTKYSIGTKLKFQQDFAAYLKAYYRFSAGALATDSSGNAHVLTPISAPAEDSNGKFAGAVVLATDDAYSLGVPSSVAYYRFSTGALTTDSSGKAHTLAAISVPTEDASGKFGYAAAFAGDDAYSAVDDADFKPTGNFSISAWVKVLNNAAEAYIFQSYARNTNYAGIALSVSSAGLAVFYSAKNTGTTLHTDYEYAIGATVIDDGNWHHLIGTWDGANLKLYVDNVLDGVNATVAWTNAPAYQATNYVRVACRNLIGGNDNFLTGSVDDFTIFNGEALNAEEIGRIYAAEIYGVNDDLQPTGAFTIGAWCKRAASGSTEYVFQSFSQWFPTYAGFILLRSSAYKWSFFTADNTGATYAATGTTLNDNTWQYVVGTWDGSFIRLYVNGVLEAQTTCTAAPAYPKNYIRIGCRNTGGSPQNLFYNGSIDDLFLVNGIALGAEDIKRRYLDNVEMYANTVEQRYAIVSANPTYVNPNSTVTIYIEKESPLLNSTITNPFYSVAEAPTLMPTSVEARHQATINNYNYHSLFRNSVINGNFDIWQRGTTWTLTDATKTWVADRWLAYNYSTTAANATFSRQLAGLDGSYYCLRLQRNEGATYASRFYWMQPFETINSVQFRGKYLTISFYMRTGATWAGNTIGCYVYSGTGTDQVICNAFTGSNIVASACGVVPPTVWTKYEGTSTSVVPVNATQIGVFFKNLANFTGTAGANDYIEIAQLQITATDVPLPFSPKSYQEELRDCQRYCVAFTEPDALTFLGFGIARSTTEVYVPMKFPVPLRVTPNSITVTASDWQLWDSQNAAIATSGIALIATAGGTKVCTISCTVAAGLTQYRTYYLTADNTGNRLMIFEAELTA